MDSLVIQLVRHFWAAAILVTGINAVTLKYWAKKHINENPELAAGYDKMIRGYFFWLNLPWFVMGIGSTIGGVPTVFHFFRPRDGNFFVLAVWLTVFIEWILSFYWIFFLKGAEKLAEYRMVVYSGLGKFGYISNPLLVKLIYLLSIAGGLIATVAMWTKDITIPPFLPE